MNNKQEITSGLNNNQSIGESPPLDEIKPTNIAAFIDGIQCSVTKSFLMVEAPEY